MATSSNRKAGSRDYTRPSEPTIGSASAASNSTGANVSFTPRTDGIGPTASSYSVVSTPAGGTGTGSSSPITVSGLTGGTSYTFQVAAVNSNGSGRLSSPTGSFTAPSTFSIDYLVVSGGGAGGGNGSINNGGGGAGGYNYVTGYSASTVSNWTVTVGGAGSPSTFSLISTSAGGAGGSSLNGNGSNGASGGGGATNSGVGGSGIAGQGNAGGNSANGWGGGGGGAGGAGSAGISGYGGGHGGNGLNNSITGTDTYYAGGGGGGGGNGGNGGLGGGGKGGNNTTAAGAAGSANTGGGGGGGASSTGGNGGSGVVILRYPDTRTITLSAGLTGSTATSGSFKVTTITAGTGTVSWA